ncbi:lipid-A-disaccharide synthase [Candidatus Babeliales bacterium]|nr:lipid-A-disaccharide synthase [Candidatus Babeliales bacterium]
MKKIFFVSGEVSGDRLGAWYLKRLKQDYEAIQVTAIGGHFLQNAGAKLYKNLEELNIVGVSEIIKKIPFIFKFLKNLKEYILQNNFEEIVLIDFPGFNLRLAKALKKANPKIKITYLSPPQTWIWGKWRIKKLKKYCDELIVLYPFEVEWYKKYGLNTFYFENPVYSKLKESFEKWQVDQEFLKNKKNQIAIIPGSRTSEIKKLLPFVVEIIKKINNSWPDLKIVLPIAQSFSYDFIEKELKKLFGEQYNFFRKNIILVQDEKEKLKLLSQCCLAITKPGTVTLELALLKVPSIVFYKTSWLTYFLARPLIKVKYMSLPNLLLNKLVFEEFIQQDCKINNIFKYFSKLYEDFLYNSHVYQKYQKDLFDIEILLFSEK